MSSHHPRRQSRPAPRGCLGVLLLPVTAANAVFRPNRPCRVIDPGVNAAQRLRTAVGVAATAWLLYTYPLRESLTGYAKDQVVGTLQATAVLIVAGPLALAAFVLASRAPGRGLYGRRLAAPLAAFTSLFGSVALAWYLLLGGGLGVLAKICAPVGVVGYLAGLAVGFGALAFALTGASLAVHFVFRVADVHEVLPPLVSPVLVWAMTALQLASPTNSPAPQWIQLLFLFAAPLSVTLLSLYELHRLRTYWNITILGALHRTPVQPAS